jgi:hypothetical protein
MLSITEIDRCLGCLVGVRRVTVLLFAGERTARAMPAYDWTSEELGKNNEVWYRRKGAAMPGPEGLRRTLQAAHYACATAPGRMIRNPSGLPRGLYCERNDGRILWLYLPDQFASPATIARAVSRKFETLRGDPATKELLRNKLRIEVVCLYRHKRALVEAAINHANEKLLQAVTLTSLVEELQWPAS